MLTECGLNDKPRHDAAMYRNMLELLAYTERNLSDVIARVEEVGASTAFSSSAMKIKAGFSEMFRELTLLAADKEPEAFSQVPYPRAEDTNESASGD